MQFDLGGGAGGGSRPLTLAEQDKDSVERPSCLCVCAWTEGRVTTRVRANSAQQA